MNIVDLNLNAWGHHEEDGVTTMFLGKPMTCVYVRAPAGLPGVTEGKRMRVKHTFKSDAACPFGANRICLSIEGGFVAVLTGSDKGVAWLKGNV